jgi:hypothetical protein
MSHVGSAAVRAADKQRQRLLRRNLLIWILPGMEPTSSISPLSTQWVVLNEFVSSEHKEINLRMIRLSLRPKIFVM